jgi:hypothetical protein
LVTAWVVTFATTVAVTFARVGTAVVSITGAVVAAGVGVTGCCWVHPAISTVEKATSRIRKIVVFFIVIHLKRS